MKNRYGRAGTAAVLAGLLLAGGTVAEAQVRVRKAASDKISLQMQGFRANDAAGRRFQQVLREDLKRSGWFSVGRAGAYAISGEARQQGRQLDAVVRVTDVASGGEELAQRYRGEMERWRDLAHRAADDITKKIAGRPGIASTRIALVGTATRNKELYLCDADGENLLQLTRDRSVSISPEWGPEGRTLYYTAYLERFPDVFRIDLQSGKRRKVAGYPGLNTGAAVSPDGREMALILSKDGNPELYIKSLSSGRLTRITRTRHGAEASPSWSPDGSRLVYVSDTSGRPQLYVVDRNGGRPSRLTSRGRENVAPDWGPGNWIACSSRLGGRYQIAVVHPDTGDFRQISSGAADFEDPSWAPNGRHIVCSESVNYRSRITILDTLGDPPLRLFDRPGDWYAPAWSPN